MIKLSQKEKLIARKIHALKARSGSHSPSLITLSEKIPEIQIKIDACFLSNPYATDIFLDCFKRELVDTGKFRDFLEFYPSQNEIIAECLGRQLGLPPENIIIGNGGVELIQAALHNFAKQKVLVSLPTFSPYYEFVKEPEVLFHFLKEKNNFKIEPDDYLSQVKRERPDTVVIINPNNPDGSYLSFKEMAYLLENLRGVETVIIDESFIHFAFEGDDFALHSVASLVEKYPNLIVLKSMSKDFGIAGIRAGYAVMSRARVAWLLKNGFLWNSNGLAEYFFRLYTRRDFWRKYNQARVRYILDAHEFFEKLGTIGGLRVIPSMANFALVRMPKGIKAKDLALALLIRHGVHVRDCADKIGLKGEYLRIASRTKSENDQILKALKEVLNGK